MALPFLNTGAKKKRDQVIAIDLGGRTTKAVTLQRRQDTYSLTRFAILDAPIYERTISAELLSEHLKNISQALEIKGKPVTLALGVNETLMRQVEMPKMPVDDLRLILKNNPKTYLQQDLVNHVYDCHILPTRHVATPADAAKIAATAVAKQKVLVAGAKKQLVDDYQTAIRAAGLQPDHILPGLLGPLNTFEHAHPEEHARGNVALVDIGYKNTSIAILSEGELILTRVVALGGDRLTAGLAENLSITYAEAETLKLGLTPEVQPMLETLLTPLGRELRASLDYFEHQQDRAVQQVYLSGATTRSPYALQVLQTELMVECKTWLPTAPLEMQLPPQQLADLEGIAPQLTVAIGAALATF